MQWSNGWRFVQFTVLQVLCNFERLELVSVRENRVRRHRPFNPWNRLTPSWNEKAECCYEWQEVLTQRLTFARFTGKHLLHCKSSVHVRLFVCPEHTNAVSRSENTFFFLFIVLSVGDTYKWGDCQEVLSISSYRNATHFCALMNSPSQCQCWIHNFTKSKYKKES